MTNELVSAHFQVRKTSNLDFSLSIDFDNQGEVVLQHTQITDLAQSLLGAINQFWCRDLYAFTEIVSGGDRTVLFRIPASEKGELSTLLTTFAAAFDTLTVPSNDYFMPGILNGLDLGGGDGGSGLFLTYDNHTADVKLIVYADTSLRAVPSSVPFPTLPPNVQTQVAVANVTVTWDAVDNVDHYELWRDGALLVPTSARRYKDWSVVAGHTYSYQVRAVNSYGMVSPLTSIQPAFVDPGLNVPPTAQITLWPAIAVPGQKQIVRIAASDIDAQALAYALSVDVGTLAPTSDPSAWYLTA